MSQDRRTFLKTAGLGSAASILSLSSIAKPARIINPEFKLLIMGTDWGFSGTRDQFCAAAKKEGYDGVEIWWPGDEKDRQQLFEAVDKHGLRLAYVYGAGESNPDAHFTTFKKNVDLALSKNNPKPLYINCHSGRDYFSFEKNKLFIDYTTQKSKATGVPIYHETHRGRMLFAAHVARRFIESVPELRITFDVSHWCNVHETLLGDQADTVDLALQRVDHIHARIGHPEGPQVNDPRAPEWENALKSHIGWWDKVIERKKQKSEQMTILTEFGPPDYLPTLPYTRQPLANQWAINVHMMKMLRERYT